MNPHLAPPRLEAVIFDWAGTLVDFGSFAPTRVFVEAFAQFGLTISLDEARGPMGMGKWDHIRTLCDTPAIDAQYRRVFGRSASDDDVTALYEHFLPLQIDKVAQYSAPIAGAARVLEHVRGMGLAIGSCSGYPRSVMTLVERGAALHGIAPDCVIASDEVPRARPAPGMALAAAVRLGVRDVAGCVKVDDTVPGIEEGRRAGMWSVGLTLSGNAAGLDAARFEALSPAERDAHRQRAAAVLAQGAPHVLIDTVAELPAVLEDIARRLARGERP